MGLLNKKEVARLKKVNGLIETCVTSSITTHFRDAGKLEVFLEKWLDAQETAEKELLREIFSASAEKSTIGRAKARDILLCMIRSLDDDENLAILLPKKLRADDVALLEKAGCPATAALVKRRLAPG
jgi:hypothetical protein